MATRWTSRPTARIAPPDDSRLNAASARCFDGAPSIGVPGVTAWTASRAAFRSSVGTQNAIPSCVALSVTTPITRPVGSNTGPPELPGLTEMLS